MVILLNGFLFLYEIGFTSFLFNQPFENLKNFPLILITLIFDPKVISNKYHKAYEKTIHS